MNRAHTFRAIPKRLPVGGGVFAAPFPSGFGVATARRARPTPHTRAPVAVGGGEPGGVGVWIDHRKAVVVYVTLGGVHTTLVLSRADRQPGRIAGHRSTARFETRLAPADDRRDRRYDARLELYYDAVIACIQQYRSILVFGPGEAKGELRRRLAANRHEPRAIALEAADKMTGRQIAAKTMDWLVADRMPAPGPRRRSGRPVRSAGGERSRR